MHKISVIVPIYRTGKILTRTLQAIKNQSFVDYECILVDDGSDDNHTREICEKFVHKDSRFRYIYKLNEGIERTRLFGVKNAVTELLVFCDHDDCYEENALELLYNAYLESNADIIVGNCFSQKVRIKNLTRKKNAFGIIKESIVTNIDFKKKWFLNFFGCHNFSVSTWGKLYKKHLFAQDFQLFNINILEDIVLNIQVFQHAQKIHFIPPYIYTHFYGGITSNFDPHEALDGYEKIYSFRKKILEDNGLPITPLLLEYKNIINQRVDLMIDNGFTIDRFKEVLNSITNFDCYNDTLQFLSEKQLSPYLVLLKNNNISDVYYKAKKAVTLKRKFRFQVKKAVSKFNLKR